MMEGMRGMWSSRQNTSVISHQGPAVKNGYTDEEEKVAGCQS